MNKTPSGSGLTREAPRYLTLRVAGNSVMGGGSALRKMLQLSVGIAVVVAVATAGALGGSGAGTITTIAGTGKSGFSGDGGPASRARLASPTGVAVDRQGIVYIADHGNARVRKVNGKTITTIAGTSSAGFSGDGGPATAAQLSQPDGLAVDAQGNVYIADYGNHRVRKVNPAGVITTIAGTGKQGFSGDGGPATAAQLDFPEGVGVDGRGNVYIADTGNSRVRRVSASGTMTTIAGTGEVRFSGDGGRATSASLSRPTDVAVDGSGNLYIADFLNYRVRKVSPGGTIMTIAGNGGRDSFGDGRRATAAELIPTSLAVDRQRNVYIGDFHNDRVRKVTPAGTITTIAGTGLRGVRGDNGPATAAQLADPSGVAVDAQGNLYIADTGNHRVRKVWIGPAPPVAISARCTKLTARLLVERQGMGDPSGETSYRALCGAFAGPGSRTMVVTFLGPTGPLDWAVFRWTGSTWQFLMRQPAGGSITAAGPDLRQTISIYRPGDSRCCPSGGTKSRLWHWNGSRFVSGPWMQDTPGNAAPRAEKSGFFKMPSGNIVCQYLVGPSVAFGAVVACAIKTGLKPALPRRACEFGSYASDRLILDARGPVSAPPCANEPSALVGEGQAGVLSYGKTWSGGGIRCTSALAGLTCRNKSGHGFFLSREKWRRF